MKILVLDEWLPSVCNSGKSIRTMELLLPLVSCHSITYLVNQLGEVDQDQLQKMQAAGFEVICVPRPKIYSSIPSIILGCFPALFDRLPISVRRHTSTDYANAVKRLLENHKFDLVHIEWSHYAVYCQYIKTVPVFVCTHNVEYLSWKRFYHAIQNPFKKLLGLHEWIKMYQFEKKFYPKIDYLSAVSYEDLQLIEKEFGMNRVCIIPNGVNISYYDEIENTPINDKIVYCGSMDTHVNQDAVLYFLREIFPLILELNSAAVFQVIGRNPPDWLLRFSSDKVSFTGSVEDVRVPLKTAALEVVPLRIAGGSRLKILEAFAAKVPVLSTTIGAEGLNVQPNVNIEIADSNVEFAKKCVHLLENQKIRNMLVENGRKIVDEQYDWSKISPMVESAWNKAIDFFQTKNKK